MTRITKRVVDAAAPDPGRRFTVWDSEVRGFGMLVLPSGVKSYVYQYRTPEGRTRRATIGQHGAFTPDQARAKAEALRRAVHDGRDPLAEKRERREAKTVADVLDAYLSSEAFAAKADKTKAIDRGRIDRHLKPLLGRAHVEMLTPEKVKIAFAAIRDGKTARAPQKVGFRAVSRVMGGEGAARKSVRLLRAALAWAVAEGLAKANAADGVKVGSDGERDTIMDDAAAYTRLFCTLDRMEVEGRIRQPVADAIRVIALTGARRGEVAGILWRHVNLKAGTLTLPPARHKTGAKTGKPRIITLPAAAQAIVARQPSGDHDDHVFAPAHGNGAPNLTKPWNQVRVEAELPEGIGLHGLRHSLASHMAMDGAQAAEIMVALGHRNMATSQKYIHAVQDARQRIAEKAATTPLAGMAASGKGNVLPLRGGA